MLPTQPKTSDGLVVRAPSRDGRRFSRCHFVLETEYEYEAEGWATPNARISNHSWWGRFRDAMMILGCVAPPHECWGPDAVHYEASDGPLDAARCM